MAAVQFAVGSTFSSFEKLEAEVKAYQNEKFVQIVKRDTRTLEMARKRVPNRGEGANTSLVYYSIHYTCAFGGKSYKSERTGQKMNQSMLKQGCQAGIKIKLSEDKQSLIITDICEDHNHVVDKDIYDHLPQQRRFDADEKENVKGLLKLIVNKKLLQQHISGCTHKVVMLKDISNLQMNEFSRRYDVLITLRDAWMNGKEVLINPLNEDDNTPTNSVSPPTDPRKEQLDDQATSKETLKDRVHESCRSTTQTPDLESLKPPPVIKKRGWPKGAEKTVIGLPRCKKFRGEQIRKPVAFLKKTTANREEVMLSWFLDRQVKESVLARKRL